MKKPVLILFCFLMAFQISAQNTNNYLLGVASIINENYTDAIEYLSKSIKDKPDNPKFQFQRGIAYYGNKNFNQAQSDFEYSVKSGINEGNLWLAKIYALDINPVTSINYLNKYLQKATLLEKQTALSDSAFKKIHFSNEWFSLVSESESDVAEQALKDVGYAKKTGKYNEVATKISNQITSDITNAYLYYARAMVYLSEENIGLAINDLKKAYELSPDDIDLEEKLADAYFLNKGFEKAFQHYNHILKDYPEKFNLYQKSASAGLNSGDALNAQKIISNYLQYITDDIEGTFLLSRANFELGRYMDALRAINKLLLNETPRAEWYHHRGMCYYKTGTLKYAAADFSMALDIDPFLDESNLYMGKTQMSLGNKDKACYFLKKAAKAGNRDAKILIIDHCQ